MNDVLLVDVLNNLADAVPVRTIFLNLVYDLFSWYGKEGSKINKKRTSRDSKMLYLLDFSKKSQHIVSMFEEDNIVKNLVPAVEQQLESEQTPFVKHVFNRLVKAGEVEEEAKMMIALCLADESNRMFIDKRDFDLARYQKLLEALPELPEG